MKTVKAQVISSTPIRLSKAASILSKFVSAENGASQAVGAYLRRTSDAFNELSQLHKELKSSSSISRRKNHSGYNSEATVGGDDESTRAPERSQEPIQPEPRSEKLIQEPSRVGEETERKRHKKKREAKVELGNSFKEEVRLGARAEDATPVRNGVDLNIDAEGGKKKHKKKRKERGDGGEVGDNEFQNGKVEEAGFKLETNEMEKKEKKKRKSVEVEEGVGIGSEEQRSKKKKRRKSGDGDD